MNETGEHILGILSGEDSVKIDIEDTDIYKAGAVIFGAMLLAVILGGIIVERLK